MKRKTNRQRLEHAFDVAESALGIARLLDAEDVDVDKPDERSIMTYVAQFLHKYPEPKVNMLLLLFILHRVFYSWSFFYRRFKVAISLLLHYTICASFVVLLPVNCSVIKHLFRS